MNKRIKELAREAADGMLSYDTEGEFRLNEKEVFKLSMLIIQECIDNLFFHGHDEAANQLEWLRVNRFGFKE